VTRNAVLALLLVVLAPAAAGCGPAGLDPGESGGAAPMRGFGISVDVAVSDRVPLVHVKTCGAWGCAEQDVPLTIFGPAVAATACPPPSGGPDGNACGPAQGSGPGEGYGYAPVPQLTVEAVTVTVTTPAGAPLRIDAEVLVRPHPVCPGDARRSACPDGVAQAHLRIAADGSVRQRD
jgi:hypothetical protein